MRLGPMLVSHNLIQGELLTQQRKQKDETNLRKVLRPMMAMNIYTKPLFLRWWVACRCTSSLDGTAAGCYADVPVSIF